MSEVGESIIDGINDGTLDIPIWWVKYIDNIENWTEREGEEKFDPIVVFDKKTGISSCAWCDAPLWGKTCEHPMYDAQYEWEHFRDNHEEMLAMVRLANV